VRFLADFRGSGCTADCGLIAAERHGLEFREWVLVAAPLLGPLL
jgi:hypothetical protein